MKSYASFPPPRVNWFIFFLYLFAVIAVFIASLALPKFRQIAYAPLREVIIPPPAPIILPVLYSTEKEAWLTEAVQAFEKEDVRINGRPVKVELEKMGSREIYLAILDGERQPGIISPASSLQINILQELSKARFGRSIVNPADQNNCRSVVTTPLVLVAWRERAELLWGNSPGQNLWMDFQSALLNPDGWGAFGHPEWGYLKFGHTDPLRSNSGFMTILLMAYSYHNRISGLSTLDIVSDENFRSLFSALERTIPEFEYSTGPLMEKMVAYGPSVYDIVAVYEATAIEQAENARGRYGDLWIYYPPATIWSDHPFCILDAEWVADEQRLAGQSFIDFLLSKPMQESAMLKYGFRPLNPAVPLDQPGSPFSLYATNGLQGDLSGLPIVDVPPGDVLNALLEFWSRYGQR